MRTDKGADPYHTRLLPLYKASLWQLGTRFCPFQVSGLIKSFRTCCGSDAWRTSDEERRGGGGVIHRGRQQYSLMPRQEL